MKNNIERNEIINIPASNNTIKRRIIKMPTDIEQSVPLVLSENTKFVIQLDESTDAAGLAQLIVFVRFVNSKEIKNQFLFCQELEKTGTGKDIFDCVDAYFIAARIKWENCLSFCTDGAASMVGKFKVFFRFCKSKNNLITFTHCFLHREALAIKSSENNVFSKVMASSITMINFIKSRLVKTGYMKNYRLI